MLSGILDVFSFVLLGHIFVANMTGNVVFLVLGLTSPTVLGWLTPSIAMVSFAIGAFGTRLLVGKLPTHRGRLLAWGLLPEWTLFAAALLSWLLLGQGEGRQMALVALLSCGMGIQNAVARSLEVPDLTTTVVTLAITGLWFDRIGPRTRTRALAVLAIGIGAAVGGTLLALGLSDWILATAFVVITGVCILAGVCARSSAPWTRPSSV